GLRVEQATTSLVPECLRCPPWAMCLGQGTTGVPPPDMLHEAGSLWLLRLLQDIQLAQFYRPILEELNRRLAEALKRHRSGLKSKNWVYKILGGFAPGQKETTPPSDSLPSLPEPDGGLKCLIPDRAVCRGELLGSGCFGVVHRGLWTLPSGKTVPVAVKSLRVGPESPGPEGTELGDFLREVSIMMNLEHPHVLCLHGLVLGQPLQMVMELAPLGSLHARLTAPAPTPPLPVALLCLFLRQVAGAMAYLGARGLVHRDLATRNLLLASPRTIKVADFGLVRSLGGARGHYVMGGPRRIPFAWDRVKVKLRDPPPARGQRRNVALQRMKGGHGGGDRASGVSEDIKNKPPAMLPALKPYLCRYDFPTGFGLGVHPAHLLFFLKCVGISKSLESVLSLGPRPTGGGSSSPELRHARTGPQGPPGVPPRSP
ncbi:hypothetical protein E2I00_008695, partial [Balaenoptera physalus]